MLANRIAARQAALTPILRRLDIAADLMCSLMVCLPRDGKVPWKAVTVRHNRFLDSGMQSASSVPDIAWVENCLQKTQKEKQ
jgi:hypothetical protein